MKLTLEKADLLQLLSIALDYELRESEVEVQAEPFEVHLKTVRLLDLAKARKAVEPAPPSRPVSAEKPRTPLPPPVTAPPPVTDDDDDDDDGDMTDVLAASAELASTGLPSAAIDPDVRGLNDFSRPLAGNESEDPPGPDFHGEIPS